MKHVYGMLLLLSLLMGNSLAIAQPMTVDADKMELFQQAQRADFYGSVEVHRENMVLKADKMNVWYESMDGETKLKKAQANGHVMITTPTQKGWADQAVFTANNHILVLTGHAKMENEQSVLQGEKIQYNTITEDVKVLKGKAGEQVHFSFDEAGK